MAINYFVANYTPVNWLSLLENILQAIVQIRKTILRTLQIRKTRQDTSQIRKTRRSTVQIQ